MPYYHRIFDEARVKPGDIRSLRDLVKLPVLKKEDVRNHTNEMISSIYDPRDLEKMRTSGSTAIPLKVHVAKEHRSYSTAFCGRTRSWLNKKENDLTARIGPPSFGTYGASVSDPLRLST